MRLTTILALLTTNFLILASSASAQPYTSEFGNGGVITIQSLKRSGSDSVILKATVENKGSQKIELRELLIASGWGGSRFGATLQDPIGKKEYQQVLIDKRPVGSDHSYNSFLMPQEKITTWARITAPPADVATITVVFHGSALPIEDVSIQR